jgi:hypothetical protein
MYLQRNTTWLIRDILMNMNFQVHIEVRDIIYKNLGGEDNHKLVKKFSTVCTLHYVV